MRRGYPTPVACGPAGAGLRCLPVTSRRLPVALLLLYVAFVVYGSFFPFDFAYDPGALAHVFEGRPGRLSIPDVVSNVLLGVPFGVLLVWSGLAGASPASRLARVTLLDAALAALVEVGQVFAPGRTSSLADVIAQVAGSLGGLLIVQVLWAGSRRPLGPRLVEAFHRRPVLFVLLALVAVLSADALYPFAVTLDVSTVWGNLKSAQWRPLGSLARAFWPDLIVERLLAYAAVGALAHAALDGLERGPARLLAWAATTGLAVGLEGGKIFIAGRSPDVDTIGLAALGALLGVTVFAALARAEFVRRHAAAWLVEGAVALLVYEELTPFSFVDSASALRARALRIEWLPLASYYGADPQSALFDLGKKIILGAAVGAAMRYASPRPRLGLVLLLAALLEAAQIFQPVHTASTTDVLTIYAGALAGAYLVSRQELSRAGAERRGSA